MVSKIALSGCRSWWRESQHAQSHTNDGVGVAVPGKVRVEPLFQSDNPFEDRYIETPDPAYAPPATGWRRFDTNFQLLVYYDPPLNGNVSRRGERFGCPPSPKMFKCRPYIVGYNMRQVLSKGGFITLAVICYFDC